MPEPLPDTNIIRKTIDNFKVNVLSVGKNISNSLLNEDRWVITEDTLAVIDGSTSRIPIKFKGKTGGQFVADVIKEVLKTTDSSLNGQELVIYITQKLNAKFSEACVLEIIKKTPETRPAALFTAGRIINSKLIITSVGDVGCRINEKTVLLDRLKIDEVTITKRIKAMKEAKDKNSNISDEELLKVGKKAIEEDLKKQTRNYYNNPDNEFGHGIIDGRNVPKKFIQVYTFDLVSIRTLEIFSDGYFKLGRDSQIKSWEESFYEVEKKDPLKWISYPAVKGSTLEQFTDDRTILVAYRV